MQSANNYYAINQNNLLYFSTENQENNSKRGNH